MDKRPVLRLDQWSVYEFPGKPFVAPECRQKGVQGKCTEQTGGDGGEFVGNLVQSAAITGVDKRTVYTHDAIIILGKIDPAYRKWVKKTGIAYSKAEPIAWGKPAERLSP